MADQKSTVYTDVLKGLSGFLSLLVPILQVIQPFLKEDAQNIFLGDRETFIVTTSLTFFLSIFVLLWVKANPYFRKTIGKKQAQKYGEFLRKTDLRYVKLEEALKVKSVDPPGEITLQTLVYYAIFIFVISGLSYLYAGFWPNAQSNVFLKAIHPIAYMCTVVSAVFILASLANQLSERETWKTSRSERISKAINLAKEHNGFDNFPPIIFQDSREIFLDGPRLIVEVTVNEELFSIVTDSNAEVLYSVKKIPSASASASLPVKRS